MFRKDLKVLDCTIRDGGLINNYQFSEEFVKAVYAAICDAGVDIIELGKKLMESDEYPRTKYGAWNFCDEDILKRVVGSYKGSYRPEIAVMFDIGRIDLNGLAAKKDSVVDMVRTACYVPQIDKALDTVKRSKDKGYKTSLNIMAVSAAIETDLNRLMRAWPRRREVEMPLPRGHLRRFYSEQIHLLPQPLQEIRARRELGFHGHYNIQLATAKTNSASSTGQHAGLHHQRHGSWRGQLPPELCWLPTNPKFDVRPIYKVIQEHLCRS
jgi:4-hydroxy 2-oxovalerate aldolase